MTDFMSMFLVVVQLVHYLHVYNHTSLPMEVKDLWLYWFVVVIFSICMCICVALISKCFKFSVLVLWNSNICCRLILMSVIHNSILHWYRRKWSVLVNFEPGSQNSKFRGKKGNFKSLYFRNFLQYTWGKYI